MFKKITGTVLVAGMAMAAIAQDSTKAVSFSGSVDAYYRYNNGKSESDPYKNSKTSFTKTANSFELGMASLRADATALDGKVTGVIDLGFGSRATEFSYNDGPALSAIKQAYITFAPSKAIKFTMGKFATHVGYELLDAPLNRNYSMSYMFTNGPFFHTGLKADITAGKIGLMVGIANHVDQTTASNQVKNVIAQISSTTSDKIKLYLNYWGYFGDESQATGAISKNQFDVVVLGTISDKFNIGYNGTVQSWKYYEDPNASTKTELNNSWWGSAVYLNYDPSSAIGLTLRGEYIGDKNSFYYSTKNVFETTLSLNYKVGPFTLVPELRLDSAHDDYFYKSDGTMTKSTASALLAAIYKF
jgi:hypothetical protein